MDADNMSSSNTQRNTNKIQARDHFDWLHRLAKDSAMSANAVRLGVVLHGYVNARTGTAWPSTSTLAAKVGVTGRSVRTLCDELVAAGYFSRVGDRRGGRAKTNVLKIELAERGKPASPFSNQKGEAGFPVSEPKGGNPAHERGKFDHTKEEAGFHRTTLELLPPYGGSSCGGKCVASGERAPDGALAKTAPAQDRFAEFWNQYPKHTSEHAARREFQRVVSDGEATEDELILGAMKYAASCDRREDGRFIRSAKNWLRDGDWNNDPPPKRRPRREEQPSAAEVMWAGGDDDE